MLAEKLTELKKEVIEYTALIETMVGDGMQGLLKKDADKLRNVINEQEPKANLKENELDEKCISLIAQYQPKAKDLRTILVIQGMNRDLERIGDHAENIAESALFLIERPQVKPFVDLPRMSEIVRGMLRDSVNAFMQEDPQLGKNVRDRDDLVDDLRELVTYMSADVSTIERALHIMRIADNLERIADLTTNVGEDVIFMVEGKVLKHNPQDGE